MKYVYLLESVSQSPRRYRGLTDDAASKLKRHNNGEVPSTAPYRPWRLVVAIRFELDAKAVAFERTMKSGSGHSFADRHFWQEQGRGAGPINQRALATCPLVWQTFESRIKGRGHNSPSVDPARGRNPQVHWWEALTIRQGAQ